MSKELREWEQIKPNRESNKETEIIKQEPPRNTAIEKHSSGKEKKKLLAGRKLY